MHYDVGLHNGFFITEKWFITEEMRPHGLYRQLDSNSVKEFEVSIGYNIKFVIIPVTHDV